MARIDNLEFLSDVIPRTQTYRQYKEKIQKSSDRLPLPTSFLSFGREGREAANGVSSEPGQTTLDSRRAAVNGAGEIEGLVDETDVNDAMAEVSVTQVQQRPKDSRSSQPNGELIFKHYHANGAGEQKETEDVEMQ